MDIRETYPIEKRTTIGNKERVYLISEQNIRMSSTNDYKKLLNRTTKYQTILEAVGYILSSIDAYGLTYKRTEEEVITFTFYKIGKNFFDLPHSI